jgi:tetratricopeptide (TPR) repeat protein
MWNLSLLLMQCLLAAAIVAQTTDPQVTQALQLIQDNQLDQAVAQLQKLMQQRGRSAALLHNLGIVEQKRGAHVKAVTLFRQALMAQRDFKLSHLLLGVSLLALNKTAEAIISLERAVKLLPEEPQAHVQLARAYERTNNWLGVVEQYQALRDQFPQEPDYAYRLGRAYTQLSEWSLQRLIAVNPDAARLHQALGQQYYAQGRFEFALAEYQRAAQVDARLPEIHLGMAVIFYEGQRYDEALREIELELKLAPTSEKARSVKAQIEKAKQ